MVWYMCGGLPCKAAEDTNFTNVFGTTSVLSVQFMNNCKSISREDTRSKANILERNIMAEFEMLAQATMVNLCDGVQ
jgi:hypothetical protein